MATIADLHAQIETELELVLTGGINSNGIYDRNSFTQQQRDTIDALYADWNAQTDAQKLQTAQFIEAKALVLAISNALNDITLPPLINVATNPHDIVDVDGSPVLMTIPNDADWNALSSLALLKPFLRTLSLVVARDMQLWGLLYPVILAEKQGYLKIMKYIKSELDNQE